MFLLKKVALSPAAFLLLDCPGNTITVASAFSSRCYTNTARRCYWKRMLPRKPTTTTAIPSSVGATVDKPTQEVCQMGLSSLLLITPLASRSHTHPQKISGT